MGDLAHKIVIAGVGFDIEVEPDKMRNWMDAPYWDVTQATVPPTAPAKGRSATNLKRHRPRRLPAKHTLRDVQRYLRQFVLHHDGVDSAEACWRVLQVERGLSCHFLLDNDGTLYQTLDLADCAFHAAGLNETSIGIEMCNRGDALEYPDFYRARKQERPKLACTIHGEQWVAYDYTEAQKKTMIALARALAKALPGIPLTYPQTSGGEPRWERLTDAEGAEFERRLAQTYAGYLGHYHITRNKWDPGPWDFRWYMAQLGGKTSFPVGLHGQARAEVPENAAKREATLKDYYDNNEQGPGGFFPIGPLERHRLYHGGLHLHVDAGAPVVAPLPGLVVAARHVPSHDAIGSTNFVLLRHDLKIGARPLRFWSLYFHLDDVAVRSHELVVDPPRFVQAGDVLGTVGRAGPEARPQLHFEIFTTAQEHAVIDKIDAGWWTVILGNTDRRFCSQKAILDPVEEDSDRRHKNGLIDDGELEAFFHENERRAEFRKLAIYSFSEWSDRPDWTQGLLESEEQKRKLLGVRDGEVADLVAAQIDPTLWWSEDVGKALDLPRTTVVYHYHPLTFLAWLAEKTGGPKESGVRYATEAEAKQAARQTDAKDEFELKEDETMLRKGDEVDRQVAPILIEDMVDGYGD